MMLGRIEFTDPTFRAFAEKHVTRKSYFDEPAVFNDLAVNLMQMAVSALMHVARRRGPDWCWCEMAVGNPMVHGHSLACLEAQLLIDNLPDGLTG